MGYPRRVIRPEMSYHGIVRAVGGRTMFESDDDARRFLSLLARAVRRDGLELEAFCLMPNHAHLLMRSPNGTLSDAMRNVLSVYARGLNVRSERSGHFVEARFWAKVIDSLRYFENLARYIDWNPVEAGLVARPIDYPYGSARLYARESGPPWLFRERMERFVAGTSIDGRNVPEAYARIFGVPRTAGTQRWFDAVMASVTPADSSLDELLAAQPPHILEWMSARDRAADGIARLAPLADAQSISASVRSAHSASAPREIRVRCAVRSVVALLEVGLLRDLARLSYVQIASRLFIARGLVIGLVEEHHQALREQPEYRQMAEVCAKSALDECHPRLVADAHL